jgi:hypothetical protein
MNTLFMIDVVHVNAGTSYVAVPGQAYQFSRISDSKVLPGAGLWIYSAEIDDLNNAIKYKTNRPHDGIWFDAGQLNAATSNVLLHSDNGLRCCYGSCMRHAINEIEEQPISIASVLKRRLLVRDFHALYQHTQQAVSPLNVVQYATDIRYPKLMYHKPAGYNGNNPVVSMYVMGEGVRDMVVSDFPLMAYGLTHQELQSIAKGLSLPDIWNSMRRSEDLEFRFDDPEESVFIGWLPGPGVDVSQLANPVSRQDYEVGVVSGRYSTRFPVVDVTQHKPKTFSNILVPKQSIADLLYFGTWSSSENAAVASIL